MSDDRFQGYLEDIACSVSLINQFVEQLDYASYATDLLVRSAVERQLMIVGEAVNQISSRYPERAAELGDVAAIVSFRNRLVHGYASVDQAIVWGVVKDDLPALMLAVSAVQTKLSSS
jgi:uncharacterized protein with HEPN domain